MRQEFDLVALLVSELQRIVEEPLVHRQERRREHGRIAAREGMIVMRRRDDQHVFKVSFLDHAQKLLAAGQLLQFLLGDAER